MILRSLWQRLVQPHVRVPQREARYVYLYTRAGSTIRGALVGRDTEAYTLDHADVAPEGASGFRQVRGRVRIPLSNVDYWVEAQR